METNDQTQEIYKKLMKKLSKIIEEAEYELKTIKR